MMRRESVPGEQTVVVRSLWRHRNFLLVWGGQTFSEFGSSISGFALTYLAVKSLNASTFQVSLLSACVTVAFLVIGLPAGAWVDRWSKRKTMLLADVGRTLLIGSIPLAYALGWLTLAQLFVVAIVSGALTVFFDVAYQSFIPALVGHDDVVEANGKLTTTSSAAQITGQPIAGAVVQAIGAAAAMLVDAVTFACSALTLAFVATNEPANPAKDQRRRLRSEIHEGLMYLLRQKTLRVVALTTSTSNFMSGMVAAIEIVFMVRVLRLPAAVMGLAFSGAGFGGVLGGVGASRLASRFGGARTALGGVVVGSGSVFLVPLCTHENGPYLIFVAGVLGAFGAVVYNINQVSYRQRLCPPELLGRMNASMRFIVTGVAPLGSIVGGVLGTTFSIRTALWCAALGGIIPVLTFGGSHLGRHREFPSLEDAA